MWCRSLKPSPQSDMTGGQHHLFVALARSVCDAAGVFRIPTGRVVDAGTKAAV
jgi:K+ transporter